jgi:hypothetical protein
MFSVVLLCSRANAQLVPKFQVALRAFHEALQMLVPEIDTTPPLPSLIKRLIPILGNKTPVQFLSSAHNKILFKNLLPKNL